MGLYYGGGEETLAEAFKGMFGMWEKMMGLYGQPANPALPEDAVMVSWEKLNELNQYIQTVAQKEDKLEQWEKNLAFRENRLKTSKEEQEIRRQTLEQDEKKLHEEQKALAKDQQAFADERNKWNTELEERRSTCERLKAEADAAEKRRDEAAARAAEVEVREAAQNARKEALDARTTQLDAWELRLTGREEALEQRNEWAASRTAALDSLKSTHDSIGEILAAAKSIARKLNDDQNTVEGGFAKGGLKSIIHQIRTLYRVNTGESAALAKELELILQQDFGCSCIVPEQGEPFDPLTMAKNDFNMPDGPVGKVVACGWMLNESILEKAIVIPQKEV